MQLYFCLSYILYFSLVTVSCFCWFSFRHNNGDNDNGEVRDLALQYLFWPATITAGNCSEFSSKISRGVTLTNSETSSSLLKNNQKFYTLTQSSPHHNHLLHVLVQMSDNKHCNNNVLYKCQYSTLPLTCGFADTLTANIMSRQPVCSVLGCVWTNFGPVWKTTALSALWIRPVCWFRGLFLSFKKKEKKKKEKVWPKGWTGLNFLSFLQSNTCMEYLLVVSFVTLNLF